MDQRVHAVIAFMKTNLHRKLTPIEIARSVRISPAHLRELFKDETGTSLTLSQRIALGAGKASPRDHVSERQGSCGQCRHRWGQPFR